MPAGRPTDYKSEYCSKIVEWRSDGWSVAECCAELDISKQCYYEWVAKHKAFGDAHARGDARYEAFWCRDIRTYRLEKNYNANAVKLQMTNNLKWGDKPRDLCITIPGWKEAQTYKDKANKLNEAFAAKILTADQYKDLQQSLHMEFEREEGLQALQEAKELKELLKKTKEGQK